jgi:hypothetical protein
MSVTCELCVLSHSGLDVCECRVLSGRGLDVLCVVR